VEDDRLPESDATPGCLEGAEPVRIEEPEPDPAPQGDPAPPPSWTLAELEARLDRAGAFSHTESRKSCQAQ
jgi:hypothetical protein